MEPSQQALVAGNMPFFGVPAPATIGHMPAAPVRGSCSNYWYHYWGMIYASQKECHGLLPSVSSLLQAPGQSVSGDVGCADASESSPVTQWQERGNENVVGNTPPGDSSYASLPSGGLPTGNVAHNFSADSVPFESFSSEGVPSSRFSSGNFSSGDNPLQTGPGIESQHHMPRNDQPARSDFSDFSNATTLLPDTNTGNHAHDLAAGFRDISNLDASLDVNLTDLTPEDYSNLRGLSMTIPSIECGMQPESAQQPSAGDNTQNAAAVPENPDGVEWGAFSQSDFSLSSGPMDPPAEVNLASAFHPFEVGAATSEEQLGSLPARSPAKPSPVVPSSASEGSGDEETPSLLSPFLTQQTVGPRMSPRTAVPCKHSGPLPSPAASLDSAPSTPVCPHAPAASPTTLPPDSERAEPEHHLAQQEAALRSHMVDEERRRWNMLKGEDRFLVVLRSSGVQWARTQALWSALHSASKSVGALKMQWRRLQDRSPWLSRLISATGACRPVVRQRAKRSAERHGPSAPLYDGRKYTLA